MCLRTFPSHLQLCRHVEHSLHCTRQLRAQGFSGTVQPEVGSKKASSGFDCLGVPRQGLGPKLPDVAIEPVKGAALRETRVWQALLGLLHDTTRTTLDLHFTILLEAYRGAFCAECLDAPALTQIAKDWCGFVTDPDLDSVSVRSAAFRRVVAEWVAHNMSAEWLCSSDCPDAVQVSTFRDSLSALAVIDFELSVFCSDLFSSAGTNSLPLGVGKPSFALPGCCLYSGIGALTLIL